MRRKREKRAEAFELLKQQKVTTEPFIQLEYSRTTKSDNVVLVTKVTSLQQLKMKHLKIVAIQTISTTSGQAVDGGGL